MGGGIWVNIKRLAEINMEKGGVFEKIISKFNL